MILKNIDKHTARLVNLESVSQDMIKMPSLALSFI